MFPALLGPGALEKSDRNLLGAHLGCLSNQPGVYADIHGPMQSIELTINGPAPWNSVLGLLPAWSFIPQTPFREFLNMSPIRIRTRAPLLQSHHPHSSGSLKDSMLRNREKSRTTVGIPEVKYHEAPPGLG